MVAGLFLFLLLCLALASPARAQGEASGLSIKVIGGLAGLSQFTRHERPFWQQRIGTLTQGRVSAEIEPFDRSGIRASEMLHLMRLGVVPFGTILLSVAEPDDPELNGADLAVLSPDMQRLRANAAAFRPRLARTLAQRYDIEVLALYAYPAQVTFCTRPFTGLNGLAGRRIRVSSVGQSDVVTALGAVPVITPFAETAAALRSGHVECAITAAMSGNAIGLHEVTTHLHTMAFSWGLSAFGVHRPTWNALPADIRTTIAAGVAELEREIWADAEEETEQGILCNAGRPGCRTGRPGRMQIVPVTDADEQRRQALLREVVLPGWLDRCGPGCVEAWNDRLARTNGMPPRP